MIILSRAIALATTVALLGACSLPTTQVTTRRVPGGAVDTPDTRITAEDGSFEFVTGTPFEPPFEQAEECLVNPTADNYRQGIATGARPVRVTVGDQQLFGLLSLCGAPEGVAGPAARSYSIRIPQSYIDATGGGLISVVYEPFTASPYPANAWILWLARSSFRRESPEDGAVTTRSNIEATYAKARKKLRTGNSLLVLGTLLSGVGVGLGIAVHPALLGAGVAVALPFLLAGPLLIGTARDMAKRATVPDTVSGLQVTPLLGEGVAGLSLGGSF